MPLRVFVSVVSSVMSVASLLAIGGAGCSFDGSNGQDVPPDAAPPDAPVDGMPVTNTCPASYQIVVGAPLTSRYRKLEAAKSWDAQSAACLADQAHLVVLDSEAELRAMQNYGANSRSFFWIGLTDRETEGVWKTVKGQVVATAELPWGARQPEADPAKADVEDCILIGSGTASHYDFNCANSYPAVCECD